MQLEAILKSAVDGDASDVHFKVGLPPVLRVNGLLYPFAASPPLDRDALEAFAAALCPEHLLARFSGGVEVDFSHNIPNVGRFRVHLFRTRGNPGLVLRHLPATVRTFRELRLPPALEEISAAPSGLVLVTGEAGGGKSTTLAAMIDHVNRRRTVHIVTIESPIEQVFTDNHSVIDQREVGTDSPSFAAALRAVSREDANVVMLSALPDRETADAALAQAESGRLVLAVSGGPGGGAAIDRVADLFAPERHPSAVRRLAAVTRAVISVKLVPGEDGASRLPVLQIVRDFGRELGREDPAAGGAPRDSRFGEGERWFQPE